MYVSTEEIITGCKIGDSRAREALYNLYSARILALCRRYSDSPEIARDLMHDSFLVIFSEIKALRDSSRLEAWMFIIVKHLAIDYYRCKKKEIETISEVELDELPTEIVDKLPSYAELIKMIEDLPERYGLVFKLSALQGLSHKEIAKILDIAEHTSSSDLYRARIMLKKALSKYWMIIPIILLLFFILYSPYKKPGLDASLISENTEEQKPVFASADSTAENRVESAIDKKRNVQEPRMTNSDSKFSSEETTSIIAEGKEELASSDTMTVQLEKKEPKPVFKNIWENDVRVQVKAKKSTPKIYFTGSLPFGNAVYPSDYKLEQGAIPIVGTWTDYKVYLDGKIARGNADARTISLFQIAKYNANNQEPISQPERSFDAPVSFGIMVDVPLYNNLYIRTGVDYTRLHSSLKAGTTNAYVQEDQYIHYIGLPVGLAFSLWSTRKFSVTPSVDTMLELPLNGTTIEKHILNGAITYKGRTSFRAPVQLSTGIGLGIQYNIYYNIGIYAEPRLRYYFNPCGNVETLRTERPLQMNLSVGIRVGL